MLTGGLRWLCMPPETLFEDKHAYGVPVKASRHPELNRYIFDVVAAIKTELEQDDSPGDVLVEVVDGDGRSLEAFALEISTLRGSYERIYDIDLRAALIRLGTLEPPPESHNELSFRVCYRPKGGGAPSLDKNAWIRRLDAAGPADAPTDGPRHPRLVALADADGSELKLQVFALLGPRNASGDDT
ncbi:hypothetical protein IWQ56_004004 [Coemansia nantahalensis]|nr:hypothetical protein IWQ56_004004 [Coemansia nantahalensis]